MSNKILFIYFFIKLTSINIARLTRTITDPVGREAIKEMEMPRTIERADIMQAAIRQVLKDLKSLRLDRAGNNNSDEISMAPITLMPITITRAVMMASIIL